MRLRFAITSLVASGLIAPSPGCKKTAPPEPREDPASARANPAEADARPTADAAIDRSLFPDDPGSPARIEISSAGEAPREPLRFALEPGTEQTASVSTVNRSKETGAINMGARVKARVKETTGDGNVRVVHAFDDIALEGMPRAAGLAEQLRGAELVQTVTPGGSVVAAEARSSSGEMLLDTLQQLAGGPAARVHLPERPVGVGARWTARTIRRAADIEIYQTASYTLTGRRGSNLDLSFELEQRSRPAAISTDGAGTVRIDTAQPLPLRAEAKGTLSVEVPGAEQQVEFRVSVE